VRKSERERERERIRVSGGGERELDRDEERERERDLVKEDIILVLPARTGKQEKCILILSVSLPLCHTVAYQPPSTREGHLKISFFTGREHLKISFFTGNYSRQPRPCVYLKEGTYHTRLFRGPSTNDMKK
jgi:hypothetical protein